MQSVKTALWILKSLNDKGKISLDEIKDENLGKIDMSDRNIARYFSAINEIFGDENGKLCKKQGNFYLAPTKKFLEFDPAIFTAFALIANMLGSSQQKFIFKNIDEHVLKALKARMSELQARYVFLTKPFENINIKILDDLKIPLEYKQQISLNYLGEKFNFKPYKIVFIDENFYLAGLDESDKFLMLRISNISNIIRLKDIFNKKSSVESFINRHIQTSWTSFEKYEMGEFIDIKLRVNSSVARYFTDKKPFLKSQKIECECDDGDKIVAYRVTQFMEIKPFIKKWLPSVEILEPVELKNEILNELREYLETQNS